MKFQLLCGMHEDENGQRYQVDVKVNEKGEIIGQDRPIIESSIDLLDCFGPEKFRKVSEEEQAHLNLLPEEKVLGTAVADAPVPDASGKFVGRNVTKEFPIAGKANMYVFFRGKNDYRVFDATNGLELTPTGSLKRKEVEPFIKKYLEG